MENRFVYFASPTEQQENTEVSKTEKAPDGLSKTADDLAQLEKLRAKPGGTKAASEARSLIDNSNVTEAAKKVLQQKIIAVEAAAADRKTGELTPQKTEALDKKTDALKKSVEDQKKELSAKAVANSKFERLSALPNANETFRDVKVSIKSKTHANTLTGFLAREDFRNLSLAQKNKYLDALYEKLGSNPDATSQVLENFSKDKRLPKKWQEYAKDPEKWGDTREHAAKWLQGNADKKILQAETAFKFLEGNSHLLEKAGIAMPSCGDVFDKSTSEFNQYFEGLKQKIAKVDTETAARMDSMKVSEGAEIKTISVKNVEAAEKEKADTAAVAEKIAPRLEQFAKVIDLAKFRTARENELKTAGKTEVATEAGAANLRERVQSGEKIGVWGAAKNILGFGKKAAADDYSEKMEGDKKEGNPEERARREVAAKMLGDPKMTDVLAKEMKLSSGMKTEDFARLESLLALEKFDAENVRAKLSPEIKNVFKNNAADDFETKKAA